MNRRIALLLATTATSFALAPAAQAQTKELTFTFISTEASSNLKTAWQPVLEDLSKAAGVPVKAFFATDYAGVIEALRFNKAQVAWMGNKSAMEAVDRANVEVFAKVVGKDGNEGYYSLLVVHKDSPLKTLDDVIRQRASLTLGFGDPNSTSGTAVPGLFAFAAHKVDPLKDFKRTVRANHETNLLAVVNKQVDVATNNTENTHRFSLTHADQASQFREIWRSPMIASDPIVWRKDLDEGLKARVRSFMLNYGKTEREQVILQNIGYSAFRPSTNAQLIPVRQIEIARERAKVEADVNLAADERQKKLAELDARSSALDREAK